MKLFRRFLKSPAPTGNAVPSPAPAPVTEDLPRRPDYKDPQYRSLTARCAMGDIDAMMALSRWHLSHARPSTQALLTEYDAGTDRAGELWPRTCYTSPDDFSLNACIFWRSQAARYGHEEAKKLAGRYIYRNCGTLLEKTFRVDSFGSEHYYASELNRLGLTDVDSGLPEFGLHALRSDGIFVAYYQSDYCPADEDGFGREEEYANIYYDEFFNLLPGKTLEEARRSLERLLKKREAYWANPAHDAPRRKYRQLHSQSK